MSLGPSCVEAKVLVEEGQGDVKPFTVSPERSISLPPLRVSCAVVMQANSGNNCVFCARPRYQASRKTSAMRLVLCCPWKVLGSAVIQKDWQNTFWFCSEVVQVLSYKTGFCLRKWCGRSIGKRRLSTLYVSYIKWQFSSVTCKRSFPWRATRC